MCTTKQSPKFMMFQTIPTVGSSQPKRSFRSRFCDEKLWVTFVESSIRMSKMMKRERSCKPLPFAAGVFSPAIFS